MLASVRRQYSDNGAPVRDLDSMIEPDTGYSIAGANALSFRCHPLSGSLRYGIEDGRIEHFKINIRQPFKFYAVPGHGGLIDPFANGPG